MTEQAQRDQSEHRTSAAQNIISNNYHAVFNLENLLIYIANFLLERTINFLGNFRENLPENPYAIINENFSLVRYELMDPMLNVLDDRNVMLDNTRDLVLIYELYNRPIAATLSSIFSLAVRNFRMSKQNNDFLRQIF
jgi:hypothetical protein